MMNSNHMEGMKQKHAMLEMEIQKEMARPEPDNMKVAEMKKQKLKLKEDMDKMMAKL